MSGEAEQHAEWACGNLRVNRCASVMSSKRLGHDFAPQVGSGVYLNESERNWAVDVSSETLHPLDFSFRSDDVFASRTHGGELKYGSAAASHCATKAKEFIFGSEGAGNRFTIHGAMAECA
ncbi:unannotated protein [freshwater metagenome]|uniref:Unannotated protein n=1 Tax=freshwater metagenome TaxID=449393 RepID=A0A6J7L9W4_9ZZZZ